MKPLTPAHRELIKLLAAVAVEEFCRESETRPHLGSLRDDQARPTERTD